MATIQELKLDFEGDLKKLLIAKLKAAKLPFNGKLDAFDVARHYFNLIYRQIDLKVRKVRRSKELSVKALTEKQENALERITEVSECGGSLQPFLSTKMLRPDYKDSLFFDWRIHHLHLGLGRHPGDPRFVERSDELLFVFVEEADLYFLDVLDHDPVSGFANQRLVEIIHQNWPNLVLRFRLNGVAPNGITNEQVKQVREVGATTLISASDGTTYFPFGGGYASDGSSVLVTSQVDALLWRLNSLENAIKADEVSIRRQIVAALGKCPKILRLVLQDWDDRGGLVEEKMTKFKLRISWQWQGA